MEEVTINQMRIAIQQHMDSNPQSRNWYAREMCMTLPTLRDFLENRHRTSPMSLGKIRQFLRKHGIDISQY